MNPVDSHQPLSTKRITALWLPLLSTWLMMAAEGPLLAAFVARMEAPRIQLAAWGVAISLAIFVEAPVIMLLSAATALAKDRPSFNALRRFSFALCGGLTIAMVLLVATPAFRFLAQVVMGLNSEVAAASQTALAVLLPWPAAIGYRRFYQGVLILGGRTRRIALGTVIRLLTLSASMTALFHFAPASGAACAAAASSLAVVAEALSVRLLSRGAVAKVRSTEAAADATTLTWKYFAQFYGPLATTSVIALAVQPLVTLMVGHSRLALESLAVLPVVNGLVFAFRAVGLSYQEVVIALLGERAEGQAALRRWAIFLALGSAATLTLIAVTPLGDLWLQGFSGLDSVLAGVAAQPLLILCLIPASTVLISYQRALVVSSRQTHSLTLAMVLELAGVAATLFLTIRVFDLVGATAAAWALVAGRAASTGYLMRPAAQALALLRGRPLRAH